MPKIESDVPKFLRPYLSHGVVLTSPDSRGNCRGDCPFCGREGKLSVSSETGNAHCWACTINPEAPKGGVNVLSFLRCLWEFSRGRTGEEALEGLKDDREFRGTEIVTEWGCCRSSTTDEWLVPGYDAQLRICQLYRWSHGSKGRILMATPKVGDIPSAGLFMGSWDAKKDTTYVCEGPWDGIALEEALRGHKWDGKTCSKTSSVGSSLASVANVVAVPGCGSVGDPFRAWLPLFKGKRVVLCFDNDDAGQGATRRAAGMLLGTAASVNVLAWQSSPWGGKDVRDVLVKGVG